MTRYSSLLLSLIGCLALAGCSFEETPAAVKEDGDRSASVVESGETDTSQNVPETSSLGDLVTLGEWDLRITKVDLDATNAIKAANPFNDSPRGQYVLVTFEATYNGPERIANAQGDLSWSFTTSDSQVHDEAFFVVTPGDNAEWPSEARQGGTVRGQVAFDLPKPLITGGILTAEARDEDFETVFADFAM